jgi:hypothetical protein
VIERTSAANGISTRFPKPKDVKNPAII